MGKRVLEWRPRLGKYSVGRRMELRSAKGFWLIMDAKIWKSSEMVLIGGRLCLAVDRVWLMMKYVFLPAYKLSVCDKKYTNIRYTTDAVTIALQRCCR